MARIELPASRIKARRRRMYLRLSFVALGLVFALFGLAIAVAHAPALLIERVEVSGAHTLATSTVEAYVERSLEGSYLYVFPKRNIFLYPQAAIARGLRDNYPVLASADAHAKDFTTLKVSLVEREPRALWCDQSQACYFMDEGGAVYAAAPSFSEPVYVPYFGTVAGSGLPRQYLTQADFTALSALVDAIAAKLPTERIDGVSVDAHNDVGMRFASGFTLIFALGDRGGDVFERLSLALGAEPVKSHALADFEYLDLRFGDKLYYKLRGQ